MQIQSPFEPDPDLAPIMPPASAAPAQAALQPASPRPVIEPAEPRHWQIFVQLEFPITVDGELLDTITIRRPTGGLIAELLIEDDDEVSLNLRVRARMCGVHSDVLELGLAADDAEKVSAACRPFLPRALLALEELEAAGEEPSGATDAQG